LTRKEKRRGKKEKRKEKRQAVGEMQLPTLGEIQLMTLQLMKYV